MACASVSASALLSASAEAVTVTVCGVSQLASVKVSEPGEAATSALPPVTPMVRLHEDGGAASSTSV